MTNIIEIDDDDGERADVMACVRLTSPLIMPDNEIGLCAQCGEAIQFRPHAPAGPRKMCWECIEPLAVAAAAKGEFHSLITPETALELLDRMQKKRAN